MTTIVDLLTQSAAGVLTTLITSAFTALAPKAVAALRRARAARRRAGR